MLSLYTVSASNILSIGPVSDHTQCKFRPVSNNSQQDQCDTVWSTTRRNIYTVEINPYFLTEKGESTNFFFSYAVFFSEAATTMCTITTTPTTNTPIQSDTSKYSETGWLASVSHNYDLSFTIPFSPYSVFSSVNSIMDSGDDSSTLGAADGGCGYYCYILCLQER